MGRRFRMGAASLTAASAALAGGILSNTHESEPVHIPTGVVRHETLPRQAIAPARAAMTQCVLPDFQSQPKTVTIWRQESLVDNPWNMVESNNPLITDPSKINQLDQASLTASKIPTDMASKLPVGQTILIPAEFAETSKVSSIPCTAAYAGMLILQQSIERFTTAWPTSTAAYPTSITEYATYNDGPVECHFSTSMGIIDKRPNLSGIYVANLTLQAPVAGGEEVLADFSITDTPGWPPQANIFLMNHKGTTIKNNDPTQAAANQIATANAYVNQVIDELLSVN